MIQREKYIDAAKGLGIILVILGHTYGIPSLLHDIIYSFHMPLFFIISGLVFNDNKYRSSHAIFFIKHKAKQYLLPYFLFSAINLALTYVWNIVFFRTSLTFAEVTQYIKGIFYCYANIEHMPNCSPLWFFMCLFWANVLFFFISRYFKKYANFISIILMLTSYIMYLLLDSRLPWNLSTVPMAVFLMQIGYVLRQYKGHRYPTIFFLLLGIIAASINGNYVGMNENTYGNLLFFLLSATLLPIAFLRICKLSIVSNCRFLLWLGRNTIPIVGLNYFLRDFTTELYYLIPIVKSYPLHWFVSFLLTVTAAAILIFATQHQAYEKII